MDANNASGPGGDPLVSREHVEQIMHRAGLDEGQIATVLDGIEFPVRLSKIVSKAMQHGLTTSALTDQMGGSP
jgi:hypothetical protein